MKDLERYLSWALASEACLIRTSPLPGGVHQNVRIDVEGTVIRSFVLRRAPQAEALGYARQVVPYDLETEFLALKDLERTGFRVPRVWGLDLEGRF